MSFSIGAPHTPSVSEDLILKEMDYLFWKHQHLILQNKKLPRKVKALEYFYRAWFLDESILFYSCVETMGIAWNATQSIIDGE